jgi:putative membrane protein
MLILILFLVAGSLLTYVSQYNLMPVTVHLGTYIFTDIPLFYVIIGSMLTGLGLSYLIYLVQQISAAWEIRGKEHEIKKKKGEVLELTKRVHQLELENEKLKHTPAVEPEDINAL